jgi:cellulose synthase operon protein C
MPRAADILRLAPLTAALLAACAGAPKPKDDNQPTLASLSRREVPIDKSRPVQADEQRAITAYRDFLGGQEGKAATPQRSEAMRRLGDLEMEVADQKSATTGQTPDYKAAVARYEDYLKAHPNDPGNDRVIYQLARAQEQGGQLEVALKTLDRLVAAYPNTAYKAEAHFRRGELLFLTGQYPAAETAYGTVLAAGADGAFPERSLYMQGWARFKQGKLEDSLTSFFGVLDRKLAGRGDDALEKLPGLTRGDRELVEDTLRVMSISLTNLQGVESIPAYVTNDRRKSYEPRVYETLGELYIKQDRVKDAADTFAGFVRRNPLHAQSPVLQSRVIDLYEKNGFATLALGAKKEYVSRYGVNSEFRKANPEGWAKSQSLVKAHLSELARHYHASAQKSKATADNQEAVKWYREVITSFPGEPDTAQNNFLLGELLYEDARFAEAATEYEKTAYGYATHPKAADAGYAALLAHTETEKRADAATKTTAQRAGIVSSLKFADTFGRDSRVAPVLTNTADKLYALKDAQAAGVAERVLKLDPPATNEQKRVATTVLAHTAFETGAFDRAEQRYGELLALVPERDPKRGELIERQAASIYKQGEAANKGGDARAAVGHFTRVAAVAPQSTVHAAAQYDAAAALIGLKDWDAAAKTLEDFRQRFPKHALADDVPAKLAVAYLEKGRWADAAGEFDRVSVSTKDPALARDALWQSAELYGKGNARAAATKAYERYLKQYPQPFDRAMETRAKLVAIAKADGNPSREFALQREIFDADRNGGAARTDRTRYLGATAALALAQPAVDAYKKVALIEPLAKQLKLKKAKFEDALKGYAVAAEYGVADVSTAATFHTAALYQDFGKAMLTSQRPKALKKKVEIEQYNLMLEDQAQPFEDKAIGLHEVNAKRSAQGVYDEWVRKSFEALKQMKPGRYARAERVEGVVDAIR